VAEFILENFSISPVSTSFKLKGLLVILDNDFRDNALFSAIKLANSKVLNTDFWAVSMGLSVILKKSI